MSKLMIPIPPKEEQEKVVSILAKLFDNVKKAQESAELFITQIDIIKKSILARAFRGKLGTNDPTDESAEALLKRIL